MRWLLATMTIVAMTGCQQPKEDIDSPQNSVYYWRSEVRFSEGERCFLRDHRISTIYLHLFDVVRDGDRLHPTTTTRFRDSIPSGVDVIPVVFLNHDILRDTTGLAALPGQIVRRVFNMMDQNGLPAPQELQLDFDWTRKNETLYFGFLKTLKSEMEAGGIGRLSVTVRLHQLSMTPPPADYGALMVYNIGNFADVGERCSILTPRNLEPYLRHLKGYPLPLCAALPIYHWDLLFHKGDHFECIVRGVDIQETTRFERMDGIHYRSLTYQAIPMEGISMKGDGRILPGDVIRHEQVTAQMLDSVRQMLVAVRPSICHQTILYHLDEKQLNEYSYDEIQKIYTGH